MISNLKIRVGVMPDTQPKEVRLPGTNRFESDKQDNMRLLTIARKYWDDMAEWRLRNHRAFMYYRGKQWYESVQVKRRDGSVVTMTEEEYIKEQGAIPFKQNVIKQVVNPILGQYRSNPTKSIVVARSQDNAAKSDMLSTVLEAALDINDADELDARNLENFIINGVAWGKVNYQPDRTKDRDEVKITNIAWDRLVFNSGITDPRLLEIKFFCEIIDATKNDVKASFARNREEEALIDRMFTVSSDLQPGTGQTLTNEDTRVNDFMIPNDLSLCRIYEIWEYRMEWRMYVHDYYDGTRKMMKIGFDELAAMNAERQAYYVQNGFKAEDAPPIKGYERLDQFWYVKYLTPYGDCLFETECKYDHKEPPYVGVIYPLVNGESWGLVEEIIDQQRYINRLIIRKELMMGARAKGVLLFPEDMKPDDMSWEDIAEEWTRFDGLIKIKVKPGMEKLIPKQIHAASADGDTSEMLTTQLNLVMQLAGVNQAMQGMKANSGTPSSLYAQEAQNSMLNIKDRLLSYAKFKRKRDAKVLSIIRQYYGDRMVPIAGNSYSKTAMMYKASEAKALKDVDVKVVEGVDTPVFRQIMDDSLFKLFEMQAIDLKTYLKNSSMPFAEKLLADVDNMIQGNITPEAMQNMKAAQQQLNPQQVATS